MTRGQGSGLLLFDLMYLLTSSEDQNHRVCAVCNKEIYYKELAHMIMEAEESLNL